MFVFFNIVGIVPLFSSCTVIMNKVMDFFTALHYGTAHPTMQTGSLHAAMSTHH